MQLIARLDDHGIYSSPFIPDPNGFSVRHAVRAILMNDRGEIALLHVRNRGYHKLPGGGVEAGESVFAALRREVREETGCEIMIVREVGRIAEQRDQRKLLQTSDCWIVRQVGTIQSPALTDKERANGFALVWYKTIGAALAAMETDRPKGYDDAYITRRDRSFLHTALQLLQTDPL